MGKVSPKGRAEGAGLRPGDAVIKIAETSVMGYTHDAAKGEMNRAGNEFLITVQRDAVDVRTASAKLPPPGNVEVIEESTIHMNEEGAEFRPVESKTFTVLKDELGQSEGDKGPRPSSIFDRKRQNRTQYLNAQGVSIQRAYGQPQ
ncbi:uncharacterized protein LOC135475451 isoform X2 [Liolophura sinensis]|uniref:uncharacterized protein LOC135475451 isoform X2 n=1 Tax=Liolophura sinensis TaxID=3198878 RepID=UPI003158E62D